MTQKEYVQKLIEKFDKEQEIKRQKLKEKTMTRNRRQNQNYKIRHYTAEEWGFGPAEVEIKDGNVLRAYKRLQKILNKDGTLKRYKQNRRFNSKIHKNHKR